MTVGFKEACHFSDARRRVLMTADTIGGVWTYALELARVLSGRNVEIALATMGAPLSRDQWQEVERIPNLRVVESTYRLEWMNDPWNDVSAAGEWLLELESAFRPHVIHLNNYAHGALPFGAPKLVVAHSDVVSWWRAVKGEEPRASWDRYRDLVRTGLRAADFVVAPSMGALTDVIHRFGPLRRTDVVPNGRDIYFRPVTKEPFIFSSGRLWDEAKNIRTLAGIGHQLPWPVRVAGDAREPDGKSVAFENVRLLGRLNDSQMAEQFERASIYCLPVRYEPFGLSALEAALAGCALVLGDIASQREIWGDAAMFVDPEDQRALRAALRALITDPVRRGALAEMARHRAAAFSASRMASAYLALYAALTTQWEHPQLCGS